MCLFHVIVRHVRNNATIINLVNLGPVHEQQAKGLLRRLKMLVCDDIELINPNNTLTI